jgi:hypothetical protein
MWDEPIEGLYRWFLVATEECHDKLQCTECSDRESNRIPAGSEFRLLRLQQPSSCHDMKLPLVLVVHRDGAVGPVAL